MIRGYTYTEQLNAANQHLLSTLEFQEQTKDKDFHDSMRHIIQHLNPGPVKRAPRYVEWQTHDRKLAQRVYNEVRHSDLSIFYNVNPYSAERNVLYQFRITPSA